MILTCNGPHALRSTESYFLLGVSPKSTPNAAFLYRHRKGSKGEGGQGSKQAGLEKERAVAGDLLFSKVDCFSQGVKGARGSDCIYF